MGCRLQIQQHLEQLLNRTTSSSDLAFLRILQLVHHQTSMLVEDLKAYELPAFVPRSPADSDVNKSFNVFLPVAGHSSVLSTSTSTLLENALEELFVPYAEGQRYIEKESKNLADLYAGLLIAFTRYHVRSSIPVSLYLCSPSPEGTLTKSQIVDAERGCQPSRCRGNSDIQLRFPYHFRTGSSSIHAVRGYHCGEKTG